MNAVGSAWKPRLEAARSIIISTPTSNIYIISAFVHRRTLEGFQSFCKKCLLNCHTCNYLPNVVGSIGLPASRRIM